MSVIGTFAPVDAIHTGVTVARLLYRMSAFIPLVTKMFPITWRDVVSGFFRMSYVTDLLLDIWMHQRLIVESQYEQLHMDANLSINSKEDDWIDKFFAAVRGATGLSEASFNDMLLRRYQFVDTMLFVQLGRPENIMILNDEENDGSASQQTAGQVADVATEEAIS